MYNPFRPGNGIEPPYLAGRTAYLREFRRALEIFEEGLPRNFLIFGRRGTGKTVLMNHFALICKEKSWLCISREFNSRFCDENIFAEAITTDIVNTACNVSFTYKVKKASELFINVLKPEEISAQGITFKPFYKEKKGILEDHLKNLLIGNWEVFKKAKTKGVVLLYDEFHTVKDNVSKMNFSLASFLGAVAQAQRAGCMYLVVLTGLPNLPVNLKEAKTYTERMFTFREIDNLFEEETRNAIRFPLRAASCKFEDSLVEQIVNETLGYPYFIQFYCYFLLETIRSKTIKLKDLDAIREKLLYELDLSFFKDRLGKATSSEQEVLLAMAIVNSSSVKPSEILKHVRVKKPHLFLYLRNLLEKNLIYKNSRGSYSFSIPLFREFLLRNKYKQSL